METQTISTVSHSDVAAAHGGLLPPNMRALFNERFVRSTQLLEDYIARLTLAVAQSTGLAPACHGGATLDEAMQRADLRPHIARIPAKWVLANLVARGWMRRTSAAGGAARYHLDGALPQLDPQELRALQSQHDPSCLPSYDIAQLAAQQYPAVLRGETSGEEALFAAEGFAAWAAYFSNTNPLYAISNALGALAVMRALAEQPQAEVLEIGGGLGSATECLLEQVTQHQSADLIARYHFTEFAPPFLRRAKKSLSAKFPQYPLSFGWVDIDRPLAEQNLQPGSFSLVYGVNVLHVARDLAASLRELRAVLREGGQLVISECVRPAPDAPVYVEFVFNLLESFRNPQLVPAWRPSNGFLVPEQWQAALQANGFTDVRIMPEVRKLLQFYPSFVVGAIIARRT